MLAHTLKTTPYGPTNVCELILDFDPWIHHDALRLQGVLVVTSYVTGQTQRQKLNNRDNWPNMHFWRKIGRAQYGQIVCP